MQSTVKAFDFPAKPQFSLKPCRVVETVFTVLLIASIICMFVFGGKGLIHAKSYTVLIEETFSGKAGEVKSFAKSMNEEEYNLFKEYKESDSFGKSIAFACVLSFAIAYTSIMICMLFLRKVIRYVAWTSVVTLIVGSYLLSWHILRHQQAWLTWGLPTIFSVIVAACWISVRKRVQYASACLGIAFKFYQSNCVCATAWWFLPLCLQSLWIAFCLFACFWLKNEEIRATYADSEEPQINPNVGLQKYSKTFWVLFLFASYWGYNAIRYFAQCTVSGALSRYLLKNEENAYVPSAYAALTTLSGPIALASAIQSAAQVLKACLEPKEVNEFSIFHAIPFYYFLQHYYKILVGKYMKWIMTVIEKCINYFNTYALYISSIYGETLVASGRRICDVGLYTIFSNDAIIVVILFLIIGFNSVICGLSMWSLSTHGGLGIKPAPVSMRIFLTIFTLVVAYVFNEVIFSPIIALARTTLVCYRLEEITFTKNHPEIAETFGKSARWVQDTPERKSMESKVSDFIAV